VLTVCTKETKASALRDGQDIRFWEFGGRVVVLR
jgi:hypothetical protein